MDKNVELNLNGKACKLPVVEGSEREMAIDISALRSETGYITLDDGYALVICRRLIFVLHGAADQYNR